jgi:hypothetical protein
MPPLASIIGPMPVDFAALARKLKLGTARRPVILGGDREYREALAAAAGQPIADALEGRHDWIQLFAQDRASLEAALPAAATALDDPGLLWISYPKGSSKLQTDLTRDQGWEAVKEQDLMWLGLISIDERWSAFSLRKYREGEARQSFR